MENEFNAETAFQDAVATGKIRLSRTHYYCIFCDAEEDCISWVPKRMNQVLPICRKCFSALGGVFKKLSGGFIWG